MAKASTGGGKSSNPSSKTGNSTSTSKASVGGGKASNPSTKTASTSTTTKASTGGGKASNPASKTSSSSHNDRTSRSSSASVGGAKASNPASKTASVAAKSSSDPKSKNAVSAAKNRSIQDGLSKGLRDFSSAIDRAFGVSDAVASVKATANNAVGKLAQDLTTQKGFTRVVNAGPGWTEVENADGTVIRREGARNWRNNNPGNLEYGDFAKKHGAIGTDGRFAVFSSYEAGRKAKESLVFGGKSYKDKSIKDAIARYAPAFENDSAGYAKQVADAAGVSVTTKMSDLSPAQRKAVLDRMEQVEGFKVGKEVAMMDASNSMQRVNQNGVYTTTYNGDVQNSAQTNDGAFGISSILGDAKNALTSLVGGSKNQIGGSDAEKEVAESKPRLGIGKLVDSFEKKDAKDVIMTAGKAIRDPLGFVLDSIEDGINQNGGFSANLAGTGTGYVDRTVPTRNQNNQAKKTEETATAAIDSSVLPTTATDTKRKPFGWSQLVVGDKPNFIV